MNHLDAVKKGIKLKSHHYEIVREIYLTYPTSALIGKEERQYLILNEISEHFNVPIMNVQVVGSAKTGYSFHKKKIFDSKTSDLDIAIIDTHLFIAYTEWVFKITNGFKNREGFSKGDGKSNYDQYKGCISKGIFRPDLMPAGFKRVEWMKFFGKLSSKNKDIFKSINAGIYLSQAFFEYKQIANIEQYISDNPI